MNIFKRWIKRSVANRAVDNALRVGFYAGWLATKTGEVDMERAIAAVEAEQDRVVH